MLEFDDTHTLREKLIALEQEDPQKLSDLELIANVLLQIINDLRGQANHTHSIR